MIKKMFHLLIVFILLIAISGITINRMECFKTGKVKASIFDIKNCCSEESSTSSTLQSKCCDFSVYYLKIDIKTTLKKQSLTEKFALYFFKHFLISYFCIFTNNESRVVSIESLPPLLFGKSLLQAICVFRI